MASDLWVLGMSYRTSPVQVRERLSAGQDLPARVRELSEASRLPEALLLSTCNRVEVYVGADDLEAVRRARLWLRSRAEAEIDEYLYERRGEEAVRHVFRVAASLDSMVVGEPQILGQIKEAYTAARASGVMGSLLDRCFTNAFTVAKRVRNETEIAAGSVSVSSIAGDLAKKIFGDLSGRRVLLIGAGDMGEQAAKHLHKSGAVLHVINRSRDKAEKIAELYGGQAKPLDQLSVELSQADVAIASTSSPRFVITKDMMKSVIKARRHRPLFLIDIAVPRDVDPRVGQMDNIFLYDVDDLSKVAEENLNARRKEAEKAERIVESEVLAFEKWRRSSSLKPTIVGMRDRFRQVLSAELERTLPRLPEMNDKQRRSLDRMVDAMVNKLLHQPISQLKSRCDHPDGKMLVEATNRLFDLDSSTEEQQRAVAAALETAAEGRE